MTEHSEPRPGTRGQAVVTGGAGDIGRAIGAALASDGYEVLLTDLVDEARGRDVAVDTAAIAGRAVDYARLDVTDPMRRRGCSTNWTGSPCSLRTLAPSWRRHFLTSRQSSGSARSRSTSAELSLAPKPPPA